MDSPSRSAIRAAAARAASRRGSSNRMVWPASQGSSSSASGTRVVFPAPGGACNTRAGEARNAPQIAGSDGSMGKTAVAPTAAERGDAVTIPARRRGAERLPGRFVAMRRAFRERFDYG